MKSIILEVGIFPPNWISADGLNNHGEKKLCKSCYSKFKNKPFSYPGLNLTVTLTLTSS